MLRQPIHFAPGATPILLEPPSSPTIVPIVCVPWSVSSHGNGESGPQTHPPEWIGASPISLWDRGGARPSPVVVLQSGVIPLVAGVLPAHDDSLTLVAEGPDLRGAYVVDRPLAGVR